MKITNLAIGLSIALLSLSTFSAEVTVNCTKATMGGGFSELSTAENISLGVDSCGSSEVVDSTVTLDPFLNVGFDITIPETDLNLGEIDFYSVEFREFVVAANKLRLGLTAYDLAYSSDGTVSNCKNIIPAAASPELEVFDDCWLGVDANMDPYVILKGNIDVQIDNYQGPESIISLELDSASKVTTLAEEKIAPSKATHYYNANAQEDSVTSAPVVDASGNPGIAMSPAQQFPNGGFSVPFAIGVDTLIASGVDSVADTKTLSLGTKTVLIHYNPQL